MCVVVFSSHDRDERKRSQSPDQVPAEISDDHLTSDIATSSHIAANNATSSLIVRDNTVSSRLSWDRQMPATTVMYCVPPLCNILSVPSYLVTQAWTTGR